MALRSAICVKVPGEQVDALYNISASSTIFPLIYRSTAVMSGAYVSRFGDIHAEEGGESVSGRTAPQTQKSGTASPAKPQLSDSLDRFALAN